MEESFAFPEFPTVTKSMIKAFAPLPKVSPRKGATPDRIRHRAVSAVIGRTFDKGGKS